MDEQTIKEKLDFYKGKPIEVHIVKKKKVEYKVEWLNGFILSEVEEGVYLVRERKLGETYVFISEIYSIEEVKKEEVKKDYNSFYQP